MRSSRPLAGALLAASIAGIALPATATTPDDNPVVTLQIQLGDLNLSRPADQAKLRRRVWAAAWKVCVDTVVGAGFADPVFGACIQKAARDGLTQADQRIAAALRKSPLLAAGTGK